MPNGQIRPIYQNIRTRDEKRYQLFSEQKINLNLKVKNEAEYIIFDFDPIVYSSYDRQAKILVCPKAPHQRQLRRKSVLWERGERSSWANIFCLTFHRLKSPVWSSLISSLRRGATKVIISSCSTIKLVWSKLSLKGWTELSIVAVIYYHHKYSWHGHVMITVSVWIVKRPWL